MTTLVHLLEQAKEKHGARTALVARRGYRTERWSYLDLWARSLRVATYLRGQGVEKGDPVILWAPNSPQWVAAYFGSFAAGAIVVPLDVRSPNDFVRKVVERTQPKLAFLSAQTAGDGECLGLPAARLEDLGELTAQAGASPAEVRVQPEDVAEVVFTSGATGDPKGVILTHRNIASNARAATQVVPSKPSYRLLSLLPLSHMLEQTVGLLSPILGGASIHYPQSRQPAVIVRAFREHRITTLVVVPQFLRLFMDSIEAKVAERGKTRQWQRLHAIARRLPMAVRRRLFASVHRQFGGSLQFIMCGGAYLSPELAQKWENMGIPVLQGYGTTEASPIISCNSHVRRKLDSVGMPLPGVEVRIAGDGEVLIRGDNVTPGYWQDTRATEAAFKGGWYATGDLGALDRDGFLHFKGRKKELIVLSSGLNVYPEDIEAALRKHPNVADAVVVGLPAREREVQVHAALLLNGASGDAKAAVEQANARLAEHQRIQGYTVWPDDDFPRTHTLKVKKHQVLERLVQMKTGAKPASPARPAAPGVSATPLARLVARLAERPAEQVTPSMRLGADLGLDSLGRVELMAAVEGELGVFLDESQLSGDTTVGELEALVAAAGKAAMKAEYAAWPLGWPARMARAAVQSLAAFPALRLVAPVKVEGREHLQDVRGPVLFAVNHQSHLDTPMVLAALPGRLRSRTAVAAASDFWFAQGRIKGAFASLLFNAFPFSRTDSIRPSLEHCSRLLDRGWSVLIYPEGTRSTTGLMGPFKSGAGLMAVELGVPVAPVRVTGTYEVLPKGQPLPKRGRVSVRFGKPLRFSAGMSYLEATAAIQEAVAALE